ncbi:MAG: DUF58 domain-containing protein [bacterium]
MANKTSNIYQRYLRPEVVSRLGRLDLIARMVVEGFIIGLHRSPYHGFSVEFAQHRQYMPGDDTKYLDWKVFGKTERFYIKEFEEETNLKCYILLDTSASMSYQSREITKLQYATYLSAALSYLMLNQQDAVGLVVFDQKIRKYLPPKAVKSYLKQLLLTLHVSKGSRRTDISATFHEMADRIKRRGLIIVISDLFDDFSKILSGLKHFRHNKHEVIVFHILDPLERKFDFHGDVVFEDLETGDQIVTQPAHIKKEYQREFGRVIKQFQRECRENQIHYVLMDTGESFEKALFEYLVKRKRIG